MSIKHFEDLKHTEVLHALSNLKEYHVTEKVDGSQLLFGIDEIGFYTSREGKGGKRIYNVDDYEIDFHTSYRRYAHTALKMSEDLLIKAGMKPGDQVEVEVLYGELPNVVEYSRDTNYLIFLRTTAGDIDIANLQREFDGHIVLIELDVPVTNNGIDVDIVIEGTTWKFVQVPKWEYDEESVSVGVLGLKYKYEEMLNIVDPVLGVTRSEVLNINLNKISQYSADKHIISVIRESIREIDTEHKKAIKNSLLTTVIRNRPSHLGPADGFIEGVVFSHPNGTRFKLVDKELFKEVHEFYWRVRNSGDLISDALTMDELTSNLDKYIKARKKYRLTIPFVGRIFKYSEPVHRRTLETFASKRRRIINETR